MKTKAQQLSERFDNDGQIWYTDDGCYLGDVAIEMGATEERNDKRSASKYIFPDGSAIVAAGGGWDFPHPDCPSGFCWEGAGCHCQEEEDWT